jgi:hypothetical protein
MKLFKAGIRTEAEAEAEAKFMLLIQTLFSLKRKQRQKHEGRGYRCQSTAIYYIHFARHSVTDQRRH